MKFGTGQASLENKAWALPTQWPRSVFRILLKLILFRRTLRGTSSRLRPGLCAKTPFCTIKMKAAKSARSTDTICPEHHGEWKLYRSVFLVTHSLLQVRLPARLATAPPTPVQCLSRTLQDLHTPKHATGAASSNVGTVTNACRIHKPETGNWELPASGGHVRNKHSSGA